jgi:alpha-galactosidase
VQIDDGWQNGATMNSIIPGGTWGDYYSNGDRFWDVNPERFPNGFTPIVQYANELNIELGLWFSPDSTDDFVYWERDTTTLLRLWKEHGVRYFKLDGITIKSKIGEKRFLQMMSTLAEKSAGSVYFNLDTTAQVRLGYLYHTAYGGLFLENRYTDRGSYYPHWTLRNLWKLCPYVPANKLQMEFLNVDRNQPVYGKDPLAPAACGIAYAFAATMFANPLAWMELSGLAKHHLEPLTVLIGIFQRIKNELALGHVLPIGQEPSGTGWTGLQCMTSETTGYLLVFREWTDQTTSAFRLWGNPVTNLDIHCLVRSHGQHRLEEPEVNETLLPILGSHSYEFTLPERLSFALYQYKKS